MIWYVVISVIYASFLGILAVLILAEAE